MKTKLALVFGMLALVGCETIDFRDDGQNPIDVLFPSNAPPVVVITNGPATPVTPPTSTNSQNGLADKVNISNFKEGKYTIEKSVTLTKVTKSTVTWTGDRNGWPQKNVKKTVNGIVYLGVIREGKVIAFGKFDWTRPGQNSKGLENVFEGYGVFSDPEKRPRSGDQVFVCVMKITGSARTITSNPVVFP